jgi:hypothetical protein
MPSRKRPFGLRQSAPSATGSATKSTGGAA